MGIDERLRASGMRMTVQRRLVLEALQRARHHVTAEDIATRIRARHPQIDPSTVYRNLEVLEALGYVTHTHFDDREPLARRLRDEHGFRADLAHSAIVGICKACSNVSSA